MAAPLIYIPLPRIGDEGSDAFEDDEGRKPGERASGAVPRNSEPLLKGRLSHQDSTLLQGDVLGLGGIGTRERDMQSIDIGGRMSGEGGKAIRGDTPGGGVKK